MVTCDPCVHCTHYYEDYRDWNHTGMVDCGCDCDCEWDGPDCGVPCPGFRPILASEGLLQQLWDEEEARMWCEDI